MRKPIKLVRWVVSSEQNPRCNQTLLCKNITLNKGHLPWEVISWLYSCQQIHGDLPKDIQYKAKGV